MISVSYRDGDHYCGYLTDYEFDVFVLNIGYQEHYQIDGMKEYNPCIDDPYTIVDFIPTVVDDIHDKMCAKTNERDTDYSRTSIYLLNEKRTIVAEDMTTHNVKKTITNIKTRTNDTNERWNEVNNEKNNHLLLNVRLVLNIS